MPGDQRVYSDEEFALILRKAAELANGAESPAASSSDGLTLDEMKSAAAQAGIDPTLVERAVRLMAARVNAHPLERVTGGPLRHKYEARFPAELDADTAARLLSAVRISGGLAGSRDVGHSSSMGMTWHDGGDLESLSVTARPDPDGTAVTVALARGGPLALVTMASGAAAFLTLLFSVFALYPESPALGVAGGIAGVGGALAVARGYWASSTRRVRERINVVMDAIEQTLGEHGSHDSGLREPGAGRLAPESTTSVADGAKRKGS